LPKVVAAEAIEPEADELQSPAQALRGRHHRSGTEFAATDSAQYLDLELGSLADWSLKRFSGRGPVLAVRTTERPRLRHSTFTDALNRRDQAAIVFLSGAWLACLYIFWSWWLQPAHRMGVFGLVVNSAVLAYVLGSPPFSSWPSTGCARSTPT